LSVVLPVMPPHTLETRGIVSRSSVTNTQLGMREITFLWGEKTAT
jgi:hypothetical protein